MKSHVFPCLMLAVLAVGAFLVPLAVAQDAEATYMHRYKVKSGEGKEVLSVKIYENKIKLEYPSENGEMALEAPRLFAGDKRKFGAGGVSHAEVKASEDGFKLRTPQGKLLWKVKIDPKKVKISDNEEGNNPFELRIDPEAGRVKVSGEGKEIAEVKFYADKGEQKVKSSEGNVSLFEMKGSPLSPMLGILALKSIPLEERMILAAELAAREFASGVKVGE
jgi:hypothetical protein